MNEKNFFFILNVVQINDFHLSFLPVLLGISLNYVIRLLLVALFINELYGVLTLQYHMYADDVKFNHDMAVVNKNLASNF